MMKALMVAWLVLLPVVAMAEIDYGQLYWTTADTTGVPFADTLRLWVAQESSHPNELMYAVKNFRWIGPTAYQLSGAGSINPSYPVPGMLTVHAHLEQPSPNFWFNGNRSCVFEASLSLDSASPTFLGGPYKLTCGISETTHFPSPFIIEGIMTFQGAAPPAEHALTRSQLNASGMSLAGAPK
jgi:hypothetical protein